MREIREPPHSESEERLSALEELHAIGVLDWPATNSQTPRRKEVEMVVAASGWWFGSVFLIIVWLANRVLAGQRCSQYMIETGGK